MTTNHEELVRELLGDLAPEDSGLLTEIAETVMRGVTVEAMSRMDEKTLEKFDALLDKNTEPEALAKFLRDNVAGIDTIVRGEIARLSELYQEVADEAE